MGVVDRRAAAIATRAVPARVRSGSAVSAPATSRRESAVTVTVCAATVSAAGSARTGRPPVAPSSTSSPRQAAITAGPAAVFFAARSYPQIVAASGSRRRWPAGRP